MTENVVREHLAGVLAWKDAHVDLETAVAGIPAAKCGERPAGAPHSPWEILEHIRVAQHDILDFCRSPDYHALKWPDDYWPAEPTPPDAGAWDVSLQRYREDRDALRQLALDRSVDLTEKIAHGDGQTCLREVLLVADHTAYHVGELVLVRRLLGIWP
jgi:hypothetical protein